MVKLIKNNFAFILVFFVSVFSVIPFFVPGFFIFHDDTQVPRIYEMGKSLSHGMFPVRWVQDLGYGFGYPIFNFYSPLPYYLGGIFNLLGLNALFSTKLVFIIGIILSGVNMFILGKSLFGKLPAVVAALVYLYFPYHAVNIYIRGDLAEVFAYAFLPLVFLGLFKIHSLGQLDPKYIAVTSLSIAAVVLSHNLSAFMLFIFILFFIIASLLAGKNKRGLIFSYSTVLFIAFLLSAFYTLPTLLEMKYTNVLSQVGGGSDYRDHFICVSQLWDSPWGFGGSAPGCLDGMSYKLGKLNIILSILFFGLFLLLFKKIKEKFIPLVSFIFLILSIFMTLEMSSFIWGIPFMDFLQFPWRFLNFTGFFMAVIIGFLIYLVAEKISFKISMVISLAIIGLTLFYNLKLFAPERHVSRSNDFYTNESYIKWEVSKISDEYLPKNFSKPKSDEEIRNSRFEIIKGEVNLQLREDATDISEALVKLDKKSDLRANIAFFPAWNIELNGKSLPYVIKEDGIYFSVPEGEHTIKAIFRETPVEKASNGLSLIGLFILGLVIIRRISIKSSP